MAADSDEYYFLQPVAIPFKWEIRPGFPKVQEEAKPEPEPEPEPKPKQRRPSSCNHHLRGHLSPPELTPPPSGSIFLRRLECRTGSFRSAPRTRSEHWRFDQTGSFRSSPWICSERWRYDRTALARQPETMSPGCFPSAAGDSLKRNESRKKLSPSLSPRVRSLAGPPDYRKDLETLARWSTSGRRSLSPFCDSSPSSSSLSSSSYWSRQSSPQPVSDAEWAAFGLF